MKNLMKFAKIISIFAISILLIKCDGGTTVDYNKTADNMSDGNYDYHIIFLHHSTGGNVWNGNLPGVGSSDETSTVPGWFTDYNTQNSTAYHIEDEKSLESGPHALFVGMPSSAVLPIDSRN